MRHVEQIIVERYLPLLPPPYRGYAFRPTSLRLFVPYGGERLTADCVGTMSGVPACILLDNAEPEPSPIVMSTRVSRDEAARHLRNARKMVREHRSKPARLL